MPNYKLLYSAGDFRKGDVVTAKEIDDTNLGGVKRLLDLKPYPAIEETGDAPMRVTEAENSPNNTKGDNVEPGSDDTVEKRAARRADAVGDVNDGTQHGPKPGAAVTEDTGDAAAAANPRTGAAGKVTKVSVAKNPNA